MVACGTEELGKTSKKIRMNTWKRNNKLINNYTKKESSSSITLNIEIIQKIN